MPSFSWWSGNAFIMMTIVAYGEKKLFLLPAFFVFYSRKLDAILLNFCCCLHQSWHIVLGHWIWFKTIFILLCVVSVRNPIPHVETRICLLDVALNWKFSCLPEKCKKKKNWWQKLMQFYILANWTGKISWQIRKFNTANPCNELIKCIKYFFCRVNST